jgi:hypothetical protein
VISQDEVDRLKGQYKPNMNDYPKTPYALMADFQQTYVARIRVPAWHTNLVWPPPQGNVW